MLYHDPLVHRDFAVTDIGSVRRLGFAGAPMHDALLRLNEAFKPELFVNHYGSCEIYTFAINQDAVGKPGSASSARANTCSCARSQITGRQGAAAQVGGRRV
jgi:2-furoate---CoA ligase